MKVFLAIAVLFTSCFGAVAQTQHGTGESTEESAFVEMLEKFSEPDLSTLTEKDEIEVYRLFIWPTFYNPLVIRVEKKGNLIQLVTKQLKGHGGYEPGGIEKETRMILDKKQLNKLKILFSNAETSAMPSKETRWEAKPDGSVEICLDGTTWIIEEFDGSRYHSVERYCPDNKKLHEIGYYFLKLGKLRISKRDLF